MARYQETMPYTGEGKALESKIQEYLKQEGFTKTRYKGASVYKKGIGVLIAPQYINYTFQGDKILLEAWLKYAIFPGVYVGELGIKGVFGGLPKKQLSKRVNKIIELVTTQI